MLRRSSATDLGEVKTTDIGYFEDSDTGIYVLVKLYTGSIKTDQCGKEIARVISEQYRYRRNKLIVEGKWGSCSLHDLQAVLSLSMASAPQAFLELAHDTELRGYSVASLAIARGKAIVGTLGENQFLLIRNAELHRMSPRVKGIYRSSPDRNVTHRSFESIRIPQRPYNEVITFDLLPGDQCILCDLDIAESLMAVEGIASKINESGLNALDVIRNDADGTSPVALIETLHENPLNEQDIFRSQEILGCINALRNVYLLQDLSYAQILKILEIATVPDHGVGLPVILQGSIGNNIYVIISGEVSVQIGDTVLAVLKSSDHFGEMALLSHSRRNASVFPKAPTRLLTIPGDALRKLLVEDAEIGVRLLWQLATELSNRLVESNKKLQEQVKTHQDHDQDTLRIDLGFSTIGN